MIPTRTPWQPTGADLDAVVAWSRSQGLTWFAKRRSPLMQSAAVALGVARILPRDVFLDQYTTVLRHRAYAPWASEPATSPFARWGRIQTVVHEVQHWLQWQREPALRFAALYLVSPTRRALWEAEAYSCNVELAAWRGDPLPESTQLAERLREYGCPPAARDAARQVLDTCVAAARERQYRTEAVLRILPLLESLRGAAGTSV